MVEASPTPPNADGPSRAALALGIVAAAHLLLLAYFVDDGVLKGGSVIAADAHGLVAYNLDRAAWAYAEAGRLSVYDPNVLAGRPAGLVHAFGGLLIPGLVLAAARLGASTALAYNMIVVALHAVVPLVGYATARLFRSSRGAAVLVAALWAALWSFDSLVHWLWHAGRVNWAAASMAASVTVALGWRLCDKPNVTRAALFAAALLWVGLFEPALLLALALSTLVVAAFAARRERLWLALAWLAPVGLVALAAARTEMLTAEPAGVVFSSTLAQLPGDLFDVLSDHVRTGDGVRAMIRTLCFAAAAVALWQRGRSDPLGRSLGAFILTTWVVGYLGRYLPLPWPSDPYLFVAAGAFVAAVPASGLLVDLLALSSLRRLHGSAKVLLGLALLVLVPRAARTVMTYVPDSMPVRAIRSEMDARVSPLVGLHEPYPVFRGYSTVPPPYGELAAFLTARSAGVRVLVDDRMLAGFLARSTRLAVLGPLAERGSLAPADWFGSGKEGDSFGDYVERYAVGAVVLSAPNVHFKPPHGLFDEVDHVAGFRILRKRLAPSYFQEGTGRVVSASLGSIKVEGASPGRVALRFHYAERLQCQPRCTVERLPVDGDPLGFIVIPNAPERFEVFDGG